MLRVPRSTLQAMAPSDARIALACLDLTSLGADDSPATAAALARRAHHASGTPAALCVYPELLLAARMSLMREGIPQVRTATVVNFPDGGIDADRAESETRRALAVGADEIELVFPWRALQGGDRAAAAALLKRVKARCAKTTLKVILQSAAFADLSELRAAAELAVACGVDFLVAATGKLGAAQSLDAARCLAAVIAATRPSVGLKMTGDMHTMAQAAACIAIAAQVYGRDRVVPARFRIGADALLEVLLAELAREPVDES